MNYFCLLSDLRETFKPQEDSIQVAFLQWGGCCSEPFCLCPPFISVASLLGHVTSKVWVDFCLKFLGYQLDFVESQKFSYFLMFLSLTSKNNHFPPSTCAPRFPEQIMKVWRLLEGKAKRFIISFKAQTIHTPTASRKSSSQMEV